MLESVYFLPHGGVIVPGMEPERNDAANSLHEAMLKVKSNIIDDNIKVIFIMSPHGYVHATDILVLFHQIFEGQHLIEINGERQFQHFLWQGNLDIAEMLFQILNQMGLPVSPLIQGDPSNPLKLAWGETIPLSYIANEKGPAIIVFGLPMVNAKFNDAKNMYIPIGMALKSIVNTKLFADIPVSLVISGDLSHKHDPNHKYGYHEDSKKFDELAVRWANNPDEQKLEELYKLNENAASCGIHGMSVLQGVFNPEEITIVFSEEEKDNKPIQPKKSYKWKNTFIHYGCPTYFGMMVSEWKRIDEDPDK